MDAIVKSLAFDPMVFIIQIVMLIALVLILNVVLFKPYLTLFAARHQGITDAYATRDRLQNDMETLRADYLTRITEIENEARTRISTAVKEAQTERERIIRETRDQTDAAIHKGVADMEREKAESLIALRGTMISLAADAAGKALGNSADPISLRRAVEQKFAAN